MNRKTFTLPDAFADVLEKNEMSFEAFDTNEAEIEFHSPLGEDVLVYLDFDGSASGFVKAFREYADSFDAEEHAEKHIPFRGKNGVPSSIRDLLDDADEIGEILNRTADQLERALEQGEEDEDE